jgi:flagellar hook-basal body complex protein FliE
MSIDAVSFFSNQEFQKIHKTSDTSENINFGDYLQVAIDKVNNKQIEAEESTQALITGEATDIHEVMLSTEEARLSLELAVQIRNKLVDAYQELSRMQI